MAMMEHFTKCAQQVLVNAKYEAQRFDHAYIGTEHLLLGLIHSHGIAGDVLRELGVELQRARSAVEFVVGRGAHPDGEATELTASARKVLEYALEEAHKLNHHYVAPEHLLLGLSRKGEGVASGLLEILGADRKHEAQAVFAHMGSDNAEQRAAAITRLDAQPTRSIMNTQPQRNIITWLLAAAVSAALVYITRLQRALQAARQRGDTYRDLLGELDRKHNDQQ
jgi:ATP-dependent Clp protease ATP-binding subunit ClpC